MSEVQLVVTTGAGEIVGTWERMDSGKAEQVAEGLAAALKAGESTPLYTDDGIVVIPARAVDNVRIRTR